MKRYDIISIGAATRDVFLRSQGIRIIRDDDFSTGEAECFALGSKIEIEDLVFDTGGGGTNTAVGFARQGFTTGYVGKIGATDARGHEIIKALKADKVDTSLVVYDRQRGTGYSVILLTWRGERTILVYRGASADFHGRDFHWNKMRSNWLYVSSLGGEMDTLRRIWRQAKQRKMRIAWNPGGGELQTGLESLRPLLQQASIVLLNQEEAAGLMHLSHDQDEQAFYQLRQIVGETVVVTQGIDGALAGDKNEAWHCGTHHVSVVDTTGAGDAFGCGYVGAIMRGLAMPRALQFATANSESVIGVVGAKPGLLRRRRISAPATVLRLT